MKDYLSGSAEVARWAVFLDRDGVLNELVEREGKKVSPRSLEEFRIIPEVSGAVQKIRRELGALAIVVTNQPDVGRGGLEERELRRMHEHLRLVTEIDDLFVCSHGTDECLCRKPRPGMLLEAAQEWGIDLTRSFVVGDTWKDIEAGRRVGCKTILLRRPYNVEVTADYETGDLHGAVEWIGQFRRGTS